MTNDWVFNLSTLTISFTQSERTVTLDPKQAKILSYLMKHGQAPVARDKLYFEIYGNDPAKSDSTINPYISKLRRLLSPSPDAKESYIKTIPKVGYQFIVPFVIEQLEIVEPTKVVRQISETTPYYLQTSQHSTQKPPASFQYQKVIFAFVAILIVILTITFVVTNQFTNTTPTMLKSTKVLVHDKGSEGDFDISFNQQLLIYVNEQKSGLNTIRVKDMDSEKISDLYMSHEGNIYSPVLSPDLSKIVFASTESGVCTIYKMQLTANNSEYASETPIPIAPCSEINAWTKIEFINNNQVAFIYYKDYSQPATIKLLDLESKKSHVLISPPLNSYGDVAFSYNARLDKIAFIRSLDNNNKSLFIYDVKSTELKMLTTLSDFSFYLSWFNNKELVFIKNDQVILFNTSTKKETIMSVPIANLKNIVVRNEDVFGKKGIWNQWDIYRFDINTLTFTPEIDSDYSEYLPYPKSKEQMYYAAHKGGSVQIWLKNKNQHQQITHFTDKRAISSFIVTEENIVVLNSKTISLLNLEGEIQSEINNEYNLDSVLQIKDNVIFAIEQTLTGTYLVKFELDTQKLTKIKQVFKAVFSDELFYYITADKQQIITLDNNANETINIFNLPKKFQDGYLWHVINNNSIFASADNWTIIDMTTGQNKFTNDFHYPFGYLHCKNVENACFFVAFLPGNTEVIRLK